LTRSPDRQETDGLAFRPAHTAGGAAVLDGRRLASETHRRLAAELRQLGSPAVCFAAVLVGADPSSQLYVRKKEQAAKAIGMQARRVELAGLVSQASVEDAVAELGADPSVHGILVQLPLPDHIDAEAVMDCIPPVKDIDGLTADNLGRLARARRRHVPATADACLRLLLRYEIPIEGRHAIVVDRTTMIGVAAALLLSSSGAEVTITDNPRRTPQLAELCRGADIIVSAANVPHLISRQHVKPGAAVLDAGASQTPAGLVGDVDFEAVQTIAGAVAPTPGGTGPMTIACLLENTVTAARLLGMGRSQAPG
jgi:methylenetetrahydrofolate dehydrogenase (NADP+) / methenyltetrahydrofolate cyclohydrolase